MRTRRLTAATVAIVALLAGLLAVPASAQPVPEGFSDLQAAADSLIDYLEAEVPEEDRDTSTVQINGTPFPVSELLEQLRNVSGLQPGTELAAWILENVSIYGVAVLPEVVEVLPEVVEPEPEVVEPETEEVEPDDEPEVAGVSLTRPTEVLGTSLPMTGADIAVLALFGAVFLSLGVLAVRRTRPKVSEPR